MTLLLLLSASIVLGQNGHEALVITKVTDSYYVYTTFKDYNGIPFPSNGAYLLGKEGAILIDTPWDTTQVRPLLDSIESKHHKRVLSCIATHSHDDRTGGFAILHELNISTYARTETDEICRQNQIERPKYTFSADTVMRFSDIEIQTYFGGEGHTVDNIVIWSPMLKVLYGGCLVKSANAKGLGYIKEANLTEWPETISRVREKFGDALYVIPGHGFEGWRGLVCLNHTLNLLETNTK